MRALFAMILVNCEIANPAQLWEKLKEVFCRDIQYQAGVVAGKEGIPFSEAMFTEGLIDLEDKVLNMGGFFLDHYGMKSPDRTAGMKSEPKELLREMAYDVEELNTYVRNNEIMLLDDQWEAYNAFLRSVETGKGGLFFLDAPGGTGKTFVTNLLLAKVRQQSKIALACASSGLAANLLDGGRTAHATFKIPTDLLTMEVPTCRISKGSAAAEVLKRCSLIVWDE